MQNERTRHTLANKELDEPAYKVNYIVAMLDRWGHTTVILQTDQEPATMSIAHAVERQTCEINDCSRFTDMLQADKQSAGHVRRSQQVSGRFVEERTS